MAKIYVTKYMTQTVKQYNKTPETKKHQVISDFYFFFYYDFFWLIL